MVDGSRRNGSQIRKYVQENGNGDAAFDETTRWCVVVHSQIWLQAST